VRHVCAASAIMAAVLWPPSARAGSADTPAAIPAAFAMPRPPGSAHADFDRVWFAREWGDYKHRFVTDEGRVVDNANGGVSHSEGQGYGLLLSALAGDGASFDAIWSWTRRTLYVRPDGLASWKWDPVRKAVTDPNNASDGDILIAWALDRGADLFGREDYREAARQIARSLGKAVVVPSSWGPILLPGVVGFRAPSQADGPVVNLSYYVFPAFPRLKALAPEVDWDGVSATGLKLLRASTFGPLRLPADWIALGGGKPRPAANFPALFGYDAIRIPLYLAWSGRIEEERRQRFAGLWSERDDLGPFVTDIATGSVRQGFEDTGYRLVGALAACSVKNVAIPDELLRRRDDLYYPSTLRLLAYAAARESNLPCL
jgi:endoglucanase